LLGADRAPDVRGAARPHRLPDEQRCGRRSAPASARIVRCRRGHQVRAQSNRSRAPGSRPHRGGGLRRHGRQACARVARGRLSELASAIELAIALAIEPLWLTPPAPPSPALHGAAPGSSCARDWVRSRWRSRSAVTGGVLLGASWRGRSSASPWKGEPTCDARRLRLRARVDVRAFAASCPAARGRFAGAQSCRRSAEIESAPSRCPGDDRDGQAGTRVAVELRRSRPDVALARGDGDAHPNGAGFRSFDAVGSARRISAACSSAAPSS